MPEEPRMLIHQRATSFYNRWGAKQDWQAFFETAQAVFEFGSGTGVCAERALLHHLPPKDA